MNHSLVKAVVAVVLAFASFTAAADAGQVMVFKGLNVTQGCLGTIIQIPANRLVPAQPLLFSCYRTDYQDSDTLVYDETAGTCMSYADFAATTTSNIEDTFIADTGTSGTLQSLSDEFFLADMSAVIWFDSATGQVQAGESTNCAEGSPQPPPPPEVITKGAFLKASNTFFSDQFGTSVAISGNTVVVGAPLENSDSSGVNGDNTNAGLDDSGAAYVYVFSGGAWGLQAYLKASNPGVSDKFGESVAISGDTLVVGAHAEDSIATGVNGDETDNTMGDSGAVYVFVRTGETWTQQAYLKASYKWGRAGDHFGYSVAIDGDSLVVGAFGEASSATGVNGDETDDSKGLSGAAYVFVRDGETWSQQAYLKSHFSDFQYLFGHSVAISGDTVVIGSPEEKSDAKGVDGAGGDNDLADDSGAAFVFNRVGETWSQQAYLKASNTDAFDQFGKSVTISGDTAVVGAWKEDSAATGVDGDQANDSLGDSGAAYVFTRNAGVWSQQSYLKASNTGNIDWFGNNMSLSGNQLVVGAVQERSNATGINGDQSNDSANQAGAAYVFERNAGVWSQRAYLKATNTGSFDQFGASTAVSDGVYVVGAHNERSDSVGVDGPDNDLMINSGAAYVILLPKEIVIDLPPEPLAPGSVFTVTAIGFKPNTLVQAFLQSEPVLVGEEMADADGKVIFQITVPLDFPPGDHSLILLGLNPDNSERRLIEPLSVVSQGTIFKDGFE